MTANTIARYGASQAKSAVTGESAALCTFADTCIRQAVPEPLRAVDALADAHRAMGDVIWSVSVASSSGYHDTVRRAVPYAVTAHLRLAELGNWSLALQGKSIECNYTELLAGAFFAACHALRDRQARAKLAEAVPLILGMRRWAKTDGEAGWLGRLSLTHEDSCKKPGSFINPGWDAGAITDNTSASFLSPPGKLQVKLASTSDARSYQQAGVTLVSARAFGFDDPGNVVYSCVQEQDGYNGSLTTSDLDSMTDNLARHIGIEQ